jgi:penicillin-binding protein 2
MKPSHPLVRRNRAAGAGLILGLLFLVLVASFFRSQVLRGTAWALQSDSNRLRVLPVPAPRGTIFDRYGEVIADNVPSYSLSLFPASRGLGGRGPGPPAAHSGPQRRACGDAQRDLPPEPAPSPRREDEPLRCGAGGARGTPPEFPGVFLEMRPGGATSAARRWGTSGVRGRSLGGRARVAPLRGVRAGMIVGKDGLERQYEAELQGRARGALRRGGRAGRSWGRSRGRRRAPPVPGDDLHLNLDLELQRYIHRSSPRDARRGGGAERGGRRASSRSTRRPRSIPGEFVGGISRDRWQALNEDPDQPALQPGRGGSLPPGLDLEAGLGGHRARAGRRHPRRVHARALLRILSLPGAHLALLEPGRTRAPGPGRCHRHLVQRLLLPDGASAWGSSAGRGGAPHRVQRACGIDLPQESAGVFPEGLDWWQRWGYRPAENEVISMVIGQGPNSQTPLKMAQFYLALGRAIGPGPPALPRRRGAPSSRPGSWTWLPESLAALQDGLRQVMSSGHGVPVAGRALGGHREDGHGPAHA